MRPFLQALSLFALSACTQIYTPQTVPSTWLPQEKPSATEQAVPLQVTIEPLTLNSAKRANQAPFVRLIVKPSQTQNAARLVPASQAYRESYPPQTSAPVYKIGIGDVIGFARLIPVTLEGSLAVTTQYSERKLLVGTGGTVSVLEVGRLTLAGLTLPQAHQRLSDAFLNAGLDPQFDIALISAKSSFITVSGALQDGENNKAMTLPVTERPISISEGLVLAGLNLARDEDRMVTLTRGNQTYHMSAQKLLTSGKGQGRYLQAKDRLVVTPLNYRDTSVIIAGEVQEPKRMSISKSRRQTLSDALYESGGPTSVTGDTSQIYLIRRTQGSTVIAYHLDASDPANLTMASELELRPNDVVFVAAQPVTNFTRITSQIIGAYGNTKAFVKEFKN